MRTPNERQFDERSVEAVLERFFAAELGRPLPAAPRLARRGRLLSVRRLVPVTVAAGVLVAISIAGLHWLNQPAEPHASPLRTSPAPPAVGPEVVAGQKRVVPYLVFDEPEPPEIDEVRTSSGATLLIRTQTGWRHLLLRREDESVAAWYAFPVVEIDGTLASNGTGQPLESP